MYRTVASGVSKVISSFAHDATTGCIQTIVLVPIAHVFVPTVVQTFIFTV